MKPTNSHLGARLRALRLDRHLTQAQLAARAGFSQAHIANLERGVRGGPAIKYATLLALMQALEVTLDQLIAEGRMPS